MPPSANASQPMPPQNAPLAFAQTQPFSPHAPPPQAAAPTPPPQLHNCPRCGTQLQFVAQYQRWFCPREQQYV
jgi:hypothetical protein